MADTKTPQNERFMPFLILVIAVLAFAVGILWQKVNDLEKTGGSAGTVANNDAAAPQKPATAEDYKLDAATADKLDAVTADDHIRGASDPQVTIVEYSDLECPYCSSFHSTALQALDVYDGQVAWVYRHFPLDTIHPKARPAAIAAECLANVGGAEAFWSFTDYVFENQTTALTDIVASAQTSTGFDISACLDAGDETAVNADYESGLNAGVTGTPGNFIVNKDGEVWLLPGAVPLSTLQMVVDAALGN